MSQSRYEELFIALSDKVERWLGRLLIFLCILLILSQLFIAWSVKQLTYSTLTNEEGVPYNAELAKRWMEQGEAGKETAFIPDLTLQTAESMV